MSKFTNSFSTNINNQIVVAKHLKSQSPSLFSHFSHKLSFISLFSYQIFKFITRYLVKYFSPILYKF